VPTYQFWVQCSYACYFGTTFGKYSIQSQTFATALLTSGKCCIGYA